MEKDDTQEDSSPEHNKEPDTMENTEDPDMDDIQGIQARMLYNFCRMASNFTISERALISCIVMSVWCK